MDVFQLLERNKPHDFYQLVFSSPIKLKEILEELDFLLQNGGKRRVRRTAEMAKRKIEGKLLSVKPQFLAQIMTLDNEEFGKGNRSFRLLMIKFVKKGTESGLAAINLGNLIARTVIDQASNGKNHLIGYYSGFIASCFVLKDSPQNKWLEKLLEEAKNKNEAKLLTKQFLCLILAEGVNLMVFKESEFDPKWKPEEDFLPVNPSLQNDIIWVIKDSNYEIADSLFQELEKEDKEMDQEIEKLVSWLTEEKKEEIEKKIEKMWQEISENPRYGIRENGLDKVEIDLVILKKLGLKSFVLTIEGFVHPAIGITFLGDYFGKEFEWKISLNEDGFLQKMPEKWHPALKYLLNYIVLDVYYRIVVSNDYEGNFSFEKRGASREIKKRFIVRPFPRRLPCGWKASEKAKMAAKIHFPHLPSCFTFVTQFEKGCGELTLKPLFTYSEKHLKEIEK